MEIITKIKEMESIKKDLNDRLNKLRQDQSKIDAKVGEIQHVLEDLNLNAVQFTKVSYKLKEVLQERRLIKEEIIILDGILTHKKTSTTVLKESVARKDKYFQMSKLSLSKLI